MVKQFESERGREHDLYSELVDVPELNKKFSNEYENNYTPALVLEISNDVTDIISGLN